MSKQKLTRKKLRIRITGEGPAVVTADGAEDNEAAEPSQASCVGPPTWSQSVAGRSEKTPTTAGASVAVRSSAAAERREGAQDPFSAEEMERMFDALPAGASGFSLKLATEAARGGQQLRRGVGESAAGLGQGVPRLGDNACFSQCLQTLLSFWFSGAQVLWQKKAGLCRVDVLDACEALSGGNNGLWQV